MRVIKAIFVFLLVFSITDVAGQVIRFKGTYGGPSYEYGYSCVQTFDKGYVAVGSTSSYSSSMDVYLFKVDSAGRMKWYKNYGGLTIDVGRSIKQLSDSGFVIAGYSSSTINGYDVFVMRTNKNGDTLWTKRYGGPAWDFAYSVYETYDSGFVVAGGTYSYGAGDEDFYLLRLNKLGDTLWTKTFGGTAEDEASCVIEASNDSGFVMVGKTKSFFDFMGNAYVIKTDKNGNLITAEEYGGSGIDYLTSIVEAEFISGFMAVGGSASYGPDEDVYMMRMNYACDTLWTKTQNTTSLPSDRETANSVAISQYDSCFVFVGLTESGTSGFEDVFFFKFDSTGYYQSATGYGTTGHDIGYSIVPATDKGFMICGQTDTTISGVKLPNVLLVKIDSLGFTAGPYINYIPGYKGENCKINVYPNPAGDYTTVNLYSKSTLHSESIRFNLYDITGKEFSSVMFSELDVINSSHSASIPINLSAANTGIYILEVIKEGEVIGRVRLVKK